MNGRLTWTAEEDARFIREWNRGTAYKVLREDFGRATSTLKARRVYLGLKPRRYLKQRRKLQFLVDEEEYRAIGRRAIERGQTVSHYLRTLVKRDLG